MQSGQPPARPAPRPGCWAAGSAFRRMNMLKQAPCAAASEPPASSAPSSIWAPLGHPLFVGLWLACAVTNMAIWMQTVGAAWIMTQLSASALMVSLVQTAITLPVFLLGLPGGVLADRMDP